MLHKRIRIASYRLQEEMRFVKRTQNYNAKSTLQPILPLVPLKLPEDEKDKTKTITFELKVRAGAAQGSPSYKKHMRTFDEGTPQEWMEVLTGVKEIWRQNSVNGPNDRAATIAAMPHSVRFGA